MILGLGSDLANIERIEATINRFGKRFIQRIYRQGEITRAERRPLTRIATYAKRFAAKEACAKALGTGFRHGVYFRDIEVTNLTSGQPILKLHNGAAAQLKKILPPKIDSHFFFSKSWIAV